MDAGKSERSETETYEQVYDGGKSPGAVSNKSTISLSDLGHPQRDNARLTKEVKHIEEDQSKGVSDIIERHDSETQSPKDGLDALANQSNQLVGASAGLLNENGERNDTLERKENERKNSQEKLDRILSEVQDLQDKLVEAQKMLDDEVLKKADPENHCQRVDEELKFKIQLREQLVDMAQQMEDHREDHRAQMTLNTNHRTQMTVKVNMMRQLAQKMVNTSLDHRPPPAANDNQHKQLLNEVSRQLEVVSAGLRDELGALLHQMEDSSSDHSALLQLTAKVNLIKQVAQQMKDIISANRTQLAVKVNLIQQLDKVSRQLEVASSGLLDLLGDLVEQVEDSSSVHRDREIKWLLDKLTRQLEDYQNLIDTKIGLLTEMMKAPGIRGRLVYISSW